MYNLLTNIKFRIVLLGAGLLLIGLITLPIREEDDSYKDSLKGIHLEVDTDISALTQEKKQASLYLKCFDVKK